MEEVLLKSIQDFFSFLCNNIILLRIWVYGGRIGENGVLVGENFYLSGK